VTAMWVLYIAAVLVAGWACLYALEVILAEAIA
jgi:hypothetical protein